MTTISGVGASTTSSTSTASTASTASTDSASTDSTASTTSTTGSGLITSSGVGSGIDTASIVSALVAAEKSATQTSITSQTTLATAQNDSVKAISTALNTFRTAISALNTTASFSGLTGTSSDTSVASTTVDETASPGNYTLVVSQLATSSKIASAVYSGGSSSVVNSGTSATTLTISQNGSDHNVNVPAGATLQQLRDSINSQLTSSNGISANIVTDSTGSRLVLSSSVTGEGSALTLGGTSGVSTGYTTTTTPQNAKYTIDGVSQTSSTNTLASAISGVSIKLLGTNTTTIAVGTSPDTLKTSVQGFVDAYNNLMTVIKSETAVTTTSDGTSTTSGAMTGDATIRQMTSLINEQMFGTTSTGLSLGGIGVATDPNTGLLTFNSTTWTSATSTDSNVTQIASLFTGTKGVLTLMTSATDAYAQSGGILATKASDLSSKLTKLSSDQTALNTRMTALQATLSAKYAAMDSLVASLNATSKSVMATLNALNNANSSSS